MAHNHRKHEISLNRTGYRIKNYSRRTQDSFLPRFGGGEVRMSDLDLFKGRSYQSFADGMLHRFYNPNAPSLYSIENMYDRYDDATLYPIRLPDRGSHPSVSKDEYVVKAFGGRLFYFYRFNGGSGVSPDMGIYIWDEDTDDWAEVTTPSAYLDDVWNEYNFTKLPTGLAMLGSKLYIALSVRNLFELDLDDVGSGVSSVQTSAGVTLITAFRDRLYFTGVINTAGLHIFEEDFSDYTRIGQVGHPSLDAHNMLEYNHRIIVAKPDGLFAYDGVQIVGIDKLSQSVDDQNYRFMDILFGQLLYFMPDGMYSFNGATIEKLYDVAEVGFPEDARAGGGSYWILHRHANDTNRYEESVGFSDSEDFKARLDRFNGRGLFVHSRISSDDLEDGGTKFDNIERPQYLGYYEDTVYVSLSSFEDGDDRYILYPLEHDSAAEYVDKFRLITPVDDDDLPFVEKHLESVDLILDGSFPDPADADAKIQIDYRTHGFEGSSGWGLLGNFYLDGQSSFMRVVPYFWPPFENVSYQRIQFKLSYEGGADISELGIFSIVKRYSFLPEKKYEWDFTVLCYGDDAHEPLLLRDGTTQTDMVVPLRSNIYAAAEDPGPLFFVDHGFATLEEDIADTGDPDAIVVDDYQVFRNTGFVQIDDEIFFYYKKFTDSNDGDKKKLSLLPVETRDLTTPYSEQMRAQFDTDYQAHTAGAFVYPLYRVFIRKIINDRVIAQGDDPDRPLESEITLRVQEA